MLDSWDLEDAGFDMLDVRDLISREYDPEEVYGKENHWIVDQQNMLRIIVDWHDEAHKDPWKLCNENPCRPIREHGIRQ